MLSADIRNVDLNLLVALDALVDECSVTRAAVRLSLTQPTVSGMLARLRDVFDDPLFVRTQRGLLPTPRTEALTPLLKRVLADTAALIAGRTFVPETAEMTVSLAVNDYMHASLVVPFIKELRRRAPKIKLAVRPMAIADLSIKLSRGEVDIAITIPDFVAADLPSRFLYRERYVCAVRNRHPLNKKKVSVKDFCRFDHVLVSPSGGAFEGPTDRELAKLGLARRVALSVPSFLILPEVLQADDLIAVVPERLLQGRTRNLRTFAPPVPVPGFDVIAVWHARLHEDPAHVWLRDLLASVATKLLAKSTRG
jgi:DNA-binding transcriptional LysR family regulator